jgi:NADH dehydrogenase
MTILVTGGTGFVGPKVVHALRAEDHPVRLLARNPAKQERFRAWGCEVVQGDMTDPESLRRATQGAETVIHLVALAPFADPKTTQRVMEKGTRDLVAAAKGAGAKHFVLMSALGVREDTKDLSAYNHAKWEEEAAVKESGLPHTIFRPSFIFGREGGLLPELVRLTRWSPVTPVPSARQLQPIWVEDVAACFAKAVAAGAEGSATWELAGPDRVTWAELFDRLRRTLGKRRLTFQTPPALLRLAAGGGKLLPPFRGAPGAVGMLLTDDNVTDIRPAVEALGVHPISLDDQLRRAVAP